MHTERFVIEDIKRDHEKLEKAAKLIKNGSLVAIPTETVYGLGANALDPNAVKRIFAVKGRPQDNPLILHIADPADLNRYCAKVPQEAIALADRFWPGPLTMILQRTSAIPDIVTAGLETVAIRCPDHPAALEVIRLAGVPVAAPSANVSGRPSPTRAAHVLEDLNGKIAAVIDGGSCKGGLESTIIDLSAGRPRLLRPGLITPEQLEEVIGPIDLDKSVFGALKEGEIVRAPGMKYRHYAPRAQVILLRGEIEKAAAYVNQLDPKTTAVLCFDEEARYFKTETICSYGGAHDYKAQASRLFSCLRVLDLDRIETIYARCPDQSGAGLAVANRLGKAAGFKILEV